MAFNYEPMDIDGLTYDDSDFMDDEMDFTPEPFIKTLNSDAISISSSFFQHPYNKSGEIVSSFSDMFGKVTLDETKDVQTKNNTMDERQLIVFESPSSSPAHYNSPIAVTEPSSAKAPVTPVLPNSPEMWTSNTQVSESTPLTTSTCCNPRYNPQYKATFVYHEAQPIDTSHGRVVYIFGLFKIACYSIVFFCCLYIGYQLVTNLHHDMKTKIISYESDILGNQMYCQEQYHRNRCGPNTRLPAVQDLCRDWEQCMIRPFSVGKTKVLAEVVGEAANGFSELLTLRTMIYSLCISFAFIWSLTHIMKTHLLNAPQHQQNKNIAPSITTRYPSRDQD